MLLGKRARPAIKRTTSMTGITVDLHDDHDHDHDHRAPTAAPPQPLDQNDSMMMMSLEYDKYLMSQRPNNNNNNNNNMNIRMTQRRNSVELVETAHFLRTCGLCNRPFIPGRDIYMYKGDTAFCTQSCRAKQMKIDERKEKCKALSSPANDKTTSSPSSSKTSSADTVAAT